ncbi:polysaccharide pyruvyl transferase family protein [Spongiibacter marinus]|uniref:polysaccharide pyruvyl transferase family protein n=1 Tax=Spongiibacter marinus TaxID=354246 RepID=UPI0003F5813A|nr:polysaccharide pyruvyl transferase family protein [Spongiibacter marinus]
MKNFDALLVGFYGMQNTGDDMLMAAAAAGAKQLFSASNIGATAAKDSATGKIQEIQGVQSNEQRFKGQDRLLKYLGALRSRHIIIGGGSVFHTAKDIQQKRHYLKLANSRRHIAAGVGLGPFVDSAAEKACAKFLNECHFTGLRDRDSFEIAQCIAPQANIALTFDLAPGLRFDQPFQGALSSATDNAIGVALCPVERFQGRADLETRRLKQLAQVLREHHQQSGAEIRLIDFNGHPDIGDNAVHTELAAMLSGLPVKIIPYNPNPYAAVHEISKLRGIVAMRLHAAIFAFLTGTPCFNLNYHPKCHNWCRDIGQLSSNTADSGNIDNDVLQTALANIWQGDYSPPSLSVQDACNKAQKNWRPLP